VIGRPRRARLLALVAAALALTGVGVAIERARLFPQLRFAVHQSGAELPSTLAVGRAEVVRGLPVLSIYLDASELDELLDNRFEHGRDWERRASVSYFDDGSLRFAGMAGVRVHGGGSRWTSPTQSFRLFFRRRYGFTRMGHNVLFGPDSQPLQRLVVHNDMRRYTGIEWRLANPLAYDLSRRVGCITPETQPARFFLNGEDLGLYVLTEHFDDEYFESHLPGRRITMKAADMEALRDRLGRIERMTVAAIGKTIDVENLTGWFLSIVFAGTHDPYQGPSQFLDEEGGRWFWVNWDMDWSFREWNMDSFQYLLPFPGERDRARRRSDPRSYVLGRLIAEDPAFRDYLARRFDTMLNHQLTPEYLRERSAHYYEVAQRFGITSLEYQRKLDEFLARRASFLRPIAEQWLNMPPSVAVSVERDDGGALTVDGFEKARRYRGLYFPGRELVLESPDGSSLEWIVNGRVHPASASLRLQANRDLGVTARVPRRAGEPLPPAPETPLSTPVSSGSRTAAAPLRWHAVRGMPAGAFEMAQTEITVAQYARFADATGRALPRQPSYSADDHPVVNITWDEAAAFCAHAGGRLPTEAEWEFAARAGSSTNYPWGQTFDPDQANGLGEQGRDRWRGTAPVASFPPNRFGLHDMVGNVWEWTSDAHPSGRALRGGAWINRPPSLRVNRRVGLSAIGRQNLYVGIRCVR
jgi:hypothetical protein